MSYTARQTRDRRFFVVTLVICTVVVATAWAWAYGPAYGAYWKYSPQEGDILFQSLPPSRLVNAIEGVSGSSYSHCGIVAKLDGRWVVYEAFRKVEVTPLKEVIFRGRNQGFAVYRLTSDNQRYISAMIHNAQQLMGKPYDVRYQIDDDRIYCSELIFKAYRDATEGQQLGALVRLRDLNWQPFEETIKHFEQGPVPLDREMITPVELARASQLELVFTHEMTTARP